MTPTIRALPPDQRIDWAIHELAGNCVLYLALPPSVVEPTIEALGKANLARSRGFTRLVIELADLPGHPARLIARRHKTQLEKCFAELLARSGADRPNELARAVWLLSEGAISLILVHGDRGYSAAASEAALTLVRHHVNE